MDRQGVFNRVRTHLLTQGVMSVDDWGSCKYRGPNGTKCAVGVLISDERYSPDLEGGNCSCSAVREAVELSLGCQLDDSDVDFLGALQDIHDWTREASWSEELRGVARRFDLVCADQDLPTGV